MSHARGSRLPDTVRYDVRMPTASPARTTRPCRICRRSCPRGRALRAPAGSRDGGGGAGLRGGRGANRNEVGDIGAMGALGDANAAIGMPLHGAALLVKGATLEAARSPFPDIAREVQK